MPVREALRLLAGNLLAACEKPNDAAARSAMLLGAHLAGVAFANAPVAGVHALAYPICGRFHVPRGLSNALMLPHVMGFDMGIEAADLPQLSAHAMLQERLLSNNRRPIARDDAQHIYEAAL